MSRFAKLLAGVMAAAMVVSVAAVPVKADAASDALESGKAYLAKIAADTEVSKAAVDSWAKYGMDMAIARNEQIKGWSEAGLKSAQANLDSINAQTAASAAAVQAWAKAGIPAK